MLTAAVVASGCIITVIPSVNDMWLEAIKGTKSAIVAINKEKGKICRMGLFLVK